MADCIFCKIVKGDIPSYKVYEDDRVLALLDIHPLGKGHTLVIPKTHARLLQDLDADDASAFFEATYYLLDAVQDAVGAPATTIAVNNGKEAGQEVPHAHLHLVPRFEGDAAGPIHALFPPASRPTMPATELEALAATIRSAFEDD
ncbi:MAG: HIT family protein [Thermoplasmatota archaeon]